MVDLRRHTRIPADFAFLVETEGGGSCLVHAVDISLGGVRFNGVGFDSPEGGGLMTRFNYGGQSFSIRADVVRERDLDGFCTEVGMAFRWMEGDTKKLLRRALHNC